MVMEKSKEINDKKKKKKASAFKRSLAIASGSFMLYRAVKRRKLLRGLGAGFLIFRGVTGIGMNKA
jgi:hypothetical protein